MRRREGKVLAERDDTPERARIQEHLRTTAERYAARIPGLAAKTWDSRKVCGDDWALLGDAAGFADPVTGEGIYYALRSAELFAEAYLQRSVRSRTNSVGVKTSAPSCDAPHKCDAGFTETSGARHSPNA